MALVATWEALYLLFAEDLDSQQPVGELTQCAAVFLGEPAPGQNRPGPVGITVALGKGTPTEFEYQVRIYGKVDADPLEAQRDMGITIEQVWLLIDADDRFVVPGFEMGFVPELGLLVATMKVTTFAYDHT